MEISGVNHVHCFSNLNVSLNFVSGNIEILGKTKLTIPLGSRRYVHVINDEEWRNQIQYVSMSDLHRRQHSCKFRQSNKVTI